MREIHVLIGVNRPPDRLLHNFFRCSVIDVPAKTCWSLDGVGAVTGRFPACRVRFTGTASDKSARSAAMNAE